MPLTLAEKGKVRYHLGYPQVGEAASIQMGIPATTQTAFLLEYAFDHLMDDAVERVRALLGKLDATEQNLFDSQERLAAAQLGNLVLRSAKARESEGDALEREYIRWARRLAEIFGTTANPYAQRFRNASGASSIPIIQRRR